MCNTLHAWCIIRIYYLLLIFCFFRYYYCVPLVNEKPGNWSYFVFAQQWPPAACLNVPPHEGCQIPKGVDDWIVHGLWPTRDKGYPSFCNNSWPFNPQALKSILQALEVKWPNIYAHSSENKFWQHEWLKHGTCAASLPMFDTELKYFKKSLELHDRLNVYEFIRKASISPSKDYPVLLSYIRNAITLHVNKTTKLFCKHHKQYSYPVLTSMYVCLDKDEQVIDCDKIDEPECDNAHVFYLPFNNTDSIRKNYN